MGEWETNGTAGMDGWMDSPAGIPEVVDQMARSLTWWMDRWDGVKGSSDQTSSVQSAQLQTVASRDRILRRESSGGGKGISACGLHSPASSQQPVEQAARHTFL